MKDNNIVDALNRVLSEFFNAPCYFESMEVKVLINTYLGGRMYQGCLRSSVDFRSASPISMKEHSRLVLAEKDEYSGTYIYKYVFVKGCSLRKSLISSTIDFL